MLPKAAAQSSPIGAFFVEHFDLGEDRDRTRAWVKRVMAHDEVYRAMTGQ